MQQLSRRFRKRLRDPRRRGVIIILAAFLIQAMFAFAAFAVDLGYIVLTSQQLQNAADAAALASVLELKSADPSMTKAQIRQNAIDEAVYAASLNKAALRTVKIDQRDILFGNRHFDSVQDKWVNTYENEAGFGDLPINSVDVRISYDGDAAPPLNSSPPSGGWPARTGREKLSLFFGRVIQVNDTVVSGDSRAHLTPRDLAFILDISGSMSDDTLYSTELPSSLFPFYNGSFPATKNYSAQDVSLPTPTSAAGVVPISYNEFTRSGTSPNWVYTPKIEWYKWLWDRSWGDGCWGTTTQRQQFADQEFGDAPVNGAVKEYWKHWKWRAFSDWAYHSGDFDNTNDSGAATDCFNGYTLRARSRSANASTQAITAIAFPKNLNVITCAAVKYAATSGTVLPRRMGILPYARFLVQQGLSGPIRGITHIPRDLTNDGTLDTQPPTGYANPLYPYPTFAGYYPKPTELANYDSTKLYSGTTFVGIYPGDVKVKPMCFVRQSTLFGIEAMISDENAGNDAYDQVGMITYGTLAHRDLELTNDLATALRIANCRVTQAGSNLNISPTGNGNTNIGMSIRQGIQMLKYSTRSRSYTNKTMALLTDGVPNIRPASGNTGNEFNTSTGAQTISSGDSGGQSYTLYWADQAAEEEITIHTICVGAGANTTLLEQVATKTGGVSFVVTDPQANSDELNNIFIAIGKDKIGKLFGDN